MFDKYFVSKLIYFDLEQSNLKQLENKMESSILINKHKQKAQLYFIVDTTVIYIYIYI